MLLAYIGDLGYPQFNFPLGGNINSIFHQATGHALAHVFVDSQRCLRKGLTLKKKKNSRDRIVNQEFYKKPIFFF